MFLKVGIGGRRITDFFLSGGCFFNGAEAELRRDGVAVFLYASIEQTLFFLYNGSLG